MYHRILVPIDGSPTAEQGLMHAIGLAAQLKSQLVVLHVLDDFPFLLEIASVDSYDNMMRNLRRRGDGLLSAACARAIDAGVPAESRLRETTPMRIAESIVDEARKSDCSLIVIGTHGRRGFHRFAMGSDAEEVMRTSPVPVLLVRHDAAAQGSQPT